MLIGEWPEPPTAFRKREATPKSPSIGSTAIDGETRMPTPDFSHDEHDQHIVVRAEDLDTPYDEGSKCNDDLRKLKEQLRQTQLACSQFTRDVAHEFNNILTIISGHADVLAISTKPTDPNQESLKAIIEAAWRATSLTRRLSSLSKTLRLRSLEASDGR